MSQPTANDLGVIVTDPFVRRLIYGTYVVLIVIAGATQAALASIDVPQPDWLTAAMVALAFLGGPITGLAAANTSTKTEIQN